ncbi:peptidase S24 [Rhizobium sp. CFBP 8762]|nr:S24 family peptidase [Rhizobium sp. CFBP 8762]MBD8556928.1 peptidase S24 [Rhizobium sp. CFBP 8762]
MTPVAVEHIPQLVRLSSIIVPAGFPSPAADDLEDSIDPIAWVVRRESSTFWWRVSGESLQHEGILDGDIIAVDRAGKKAPGRIVLAVVDGGVTIKKLARRDGRLWLDPSSDNPAYKPILVTETTEFWGVVAGVVRRYPID